ncbi:hypothetical protein E3O54_00305 [Cryobacterium sp. TMT2-4]|nr:hypothetical protein E3O54_00305 [Cryobacterium sp. TMT2-4]
MTQQVDLIDGESLVLDVTDHPDLDRRARKRLKIVLSMSNGVQTITAGEFSALSWLEAMALSDPLELVKRIEGVMGLTPEPEPLCPKSARALVFTVLALFLAARVNDAKPWHVRSLNPLTLGVDDWVPTDLSRFPVLEHRLIEEFESAAVRMSGSLTSAWILYRGFDPVAALDEEAGLHARGLRFDLHEIYVDNGCDIHTTTNQISSKFGS